MSFKIVLRVRGIIITSSKVHPISAVWAFGISSVVVNVRPTKAKHYAQANRANNKAGTHMCFHFCPRVLGLAVVALRDFCRALAQQA